jgi:hypothetical protein
MTKASLSLSNIEVKRFYSGSTNVDSRLTFNSNSQSVVSFDSVKAIIMNNVESAQTQLGLNLASVADNSQNNPTSSPIKSDGNSITRSNTLITIIIINLISILF